MDIIFVEKMTVKLLLVFLIEVSGVSIEISTRLHNELLIGCHKHVYLLLMLHHVVNYSPTLFHLPILHIV